jgi:hypothetical protein
MLRVHCAVLKLRAVPIPCTGAYPPPAPAATPPQGAATGHRTTSGSTEETVRSREPHHHTPRPLAQHHPTTGHHHTRRPGAGSEASSPEGRAESPFPQDPTVRQAATPTRTRVPPRPPPEGDDQEYLRTAQQRRPTSRRSTHEQPPRERTSRAWPLDAENPRRAGAKTLLRKEVIQPHLPVRLPCYDFVPIASPTFDSSLPQGVGPPASGVTDFRDVTGGVYKPRERIHRSVADLRLLATPTSWGRVADPNPN